MRNSFWTGFIIYVLWNCTTMVVMAVDKHKAKHNKWRISESTLFLLALALGGLGIWTGMNLFRHKTKQRRFTFGIPILLALNVVVIFGLYRLGLAF